jgi:hypothetical protein
VNCDILSQKVVPIFSWRFRFGRIGDQVRTVLLGQISFLAHDFIVY